MDDEAEDVRKTPCRGCPFRVRNRSREDAKLLSRKSLTDTDRPVRQVLKEWGCQEDMMDDFTMASRRCAGASIILGETFASSKAEIGLLDPSHIEL